MVILSNFITLIISMWIARWVYQTLYRLAPIYGVYRLRGLILFGITILCYRFLNVAILEIVLTAQSN